MRTSSVPPFVKLPDHVDGEALFETALRLERRLHLNLDRIDHALADLKVDYAAYCRPTPASPPGYWVEWFHRKAPNFLSYLQVYAQIIAMAIPKGAKDLSKMRLLDFGGGWGLMALLAKECGFGHVTYLDIDPGVCAAAQRIAISVHLPVDEFLCGDENLLLGRRNGFEAVVSSDVLEHVYDTEPLFHALSCACVPGGVVFFHTGANPKNPYQFLTLTRLHRRCETEHKATLEVLHHEGQRAIWEDRLEVIKARANRLPEGEAYQLARLTRGLNQLDLERAIDAYLERGVVPTPAHRSNTCYLNGYWLERMMDPYSVARDLSRYGFTTRVTQSFWGPGRSSRWARLAKHSLNFLAGLSVPIGLRCTLYYGIRGAKTSGNCP